MLIAAAVRAPTSVAIALFTLAVSAASLVNSPVVRLVSGCFDAQALRPAAAIAANAALIMLRLARFIGFPFHRLVVARLHRIERPLRRLRLVLLVHQRRDSQSLTWRSA